MNLITHRFSLDVNVTSAQLCLSCKKGDTAHRLEITLTDNGEPYEITTGCTAIFTATKADGNALCNPCNIEGNTITYDFTEQTVSCEGLVDVEIRVSDGDLVLTSPSFLLVVDAPIVDDGNILSSAEAKAVVALVAAVHRAKDDAMAALEAERLATAGATQANIAAGDAAKKAQEAAAAVEGCEMAAMRANEAAQWADDMANAAHQAAQFILTEDINCGDTLPEPGTPGRLFFLKAKRA